MKREEKELLREYLLDMNLTQSAVLLISRLLREFATSCCSDVATQGKVSILLQLLGVLEKQLERRNEIYRSALEKSITPEWQELKKKAESLSLPVEESLLVSEMEELISLLRKIGALPDDFLKPPSEQE